MSKKSIYIIPVAIIIIFSFYIFSKNYDSKVDAEIENLYLYKETILDNEEDVKEIIDKANFSSYNISDVVIEKYSTPKKITVYFIVDDRAEHSNIDYISLNKNSALIFSLVKDVQEISYLFFDKYSDLNKLETAFSGSYYSRNFLYEKKGMEEFKIEYINASTSTIDLFEDYYNEVINISFKNPIRTLLSEILKFLGSDYEIVTGSSISCDIKLDSLPESNDYEKLKYILGSQLSEYTSTPHTMTLTLYDVRNLKTDEYKNYLIAFYDEPENGIIIISQKLIENKQESDEIKNQIKKRN